MSNSTLPLILIGVLLGYFYAHAEIRLECQRLGAFYVGNSVFECKEKP